jgi:hypothetical protein
LLYLHQHKEPPRRKTGTSERVRVNRGQRRVNMVNIFYIVI